MASSYSSQARKAYTTGGNVQAFACSDRASYIAISGGLGARAPRTSDANRLLARPVDGRREHQGVSERFITPDTIWVWALGLPETEIAIRYLPLGFWACRPGVRAPAAE